MKIVISFFMLGSLCLALAFLSSGPAGHSHDGAQERKTSLHRKIDDKHDSLEAYKRAKQNPSTVKIVESEIDQFIKNHPDFFGEVEISLTSQTPELEPEDSPGIQESDRIFNKINQEQAIQDLNEINDGDELDGYPNEKIEAAYAVLDEAMEE